MSPKLSIVIVTWNSKTDLEVCLSSVYKNTELREKEIIVVDNGSIDGSAEYIENEYPNIILSKNKKNIGVAPGRNQGIRIAKGKYILILDVDTKVKRGAIDILVEGMEKHPEVGLSGPKLLSPDGNLQYSCRELPTIWSKIAARFLPINLSSLFLRGEAYSDWDHSTPSYVGYVIGACHLIRKKTMDKAGLYDGRIFYGPEDMELCLRFWKAGWKIMYNPLAEVIHKEQRITSGRLLTQIRTRLFWMHVKGLVIHFLNHRYLIRRPGLFFSNSVNGSSRVESSKTSHPYVSILVPCYNEEKYIKQCLDSLLDEFVITNAEILISDAMSTDDTRKIIKRYIKDHDNITIKLLDNPEKHQSYGLNSAIDKARGKIIVRADAHTKYPKGYVKKCVDVLENSDADVIGGVMSAKGKTRFQKLAALAMKHPVGVGDAKFHLGNYSGYVDTVYLGTFWKSIFGKFGYFDPYPNQDAEFNLRILKSGGNIYLDKSIKVEYFPRDSLKKLATQYFNYGKGRCRTTLKHRRFTSLRQLAPILLVMGLFGSFFLSLVLNPVFLLFPLLYIISIIFSSFLALRKGKVRRLSDMLTLSVIFMSMHISWGVGFLAKFLKLVK